MKRYLTGFFCALYLVVFCLAQITTANAYSQPSTTFNKIVFLGDSLSDNGNLYNSDLGYLPKSPPYYQGRFSNGIVWSEHAAKYYQSQYSMNSSIYAVGGETAILHALSGEVSIYTLTGSVDSYLLHSIFQDRSRTLFVIWVGANDYLRGIDDVDDLTNKVVSSIKSAVETLIYHGGNNFLVINLPNLSQIPFGQMSGFTQTLNDATALHNQKLLTAVQEVRQDYQNVNIHYFDVDQVFKSIKTDTAAFNNKYQIHISNTTEACWQGSYSLKASQLRTNTIESQLQQHINLHPEKLNRNNPDSQNFNAKSFSKFVANSPDLLEAYNVAQEAENDQLPCSNPDDYLFWDHVHPSAVIHKTLATILIDFINHNYSPI